MVRHFITLVFMIRAIGFADLLAEREVNSCTVIRNTIKELNGSLFPYETIHITLLKECPHVIPTLVDWMYGEWHSYDKELTKEKLTYSFSRRLNDDRIPFILVFWKHNKPIGMIGLKEKGASEFDDLREATPWGGSFYVIPEERNKGLGEKIAQALMTIAARLGYRELFFYTSNPTSAQWYLSRKAELIEIRPFRGHTVAILKASLEGK